MHIITLQPSLHTHSPLGCCGKHPCGIKVRGGEIPPRGQEPTDDAPHRWGPSITGTPSPNMPYGNSSVPSARRDFETKTHKHIMWRNQRDLWSVFLPQILSRLCGDPHFVLCSLHPRWKPEKPKMNRKQFNSGSSATAISGKSSDFIILLNSKLNCAE